MSTDFWLIHTGWQAIRYAHLNFQLRWAKNTMLIENKNNNVTE